MNHIQKLNKQNRQNMRKYQNIYSLGLLIFGLSLFGILTRPTGLLASFWPANAVLLGILIRYPKIACPISGIVVFIAYIAADILTGTSFSLSIFLTIGNLVGVYTGFFLYQQMPPEHKYLKQPLSVMYLVGICILAAMMAGVVGMMGYPYFFHGTRWTGFSYWLITELMNFIAILPVILTAPTFSWAKLLNRRRNKIDLRLNSLLPFSSLLAGGVLGWWIGGPGALSFLVPGLIWCALSYGLFPTALQTLLSSMWVLLAPAKGYLDLGVSLNEIYTLDSFRLGVTMTTLAPLAIASAMASRNRLIEKLQYNSTHDSLTNTLNRSGLFQQANALRSSNQSMAVLMLDIDHFKQVNDTYGHATGDLVLVELTKVVKKCLRQDDVLGRLGGEEFGIVCPDIHINDAKAIAERICTNCAMHDFKNDSLINLPVTVSIGMAYDGAPPSRVTLEELMLKADAALYEAKHQGRNRIVIRN